MSVCISKDGEYSEHKFGGAASIILGEFTCKRCHVYDGIAAEDEINRLRSLVARLADPDPCWFDHNGGCQAHGYHDLKPGEICPMAEAQKVAALVGEHRGGGL